MIEKCPCKLKALCKVNLFKIQRKKIKQNWSLWAIHNDMISPTPKFKIFVDYSYIRSKKLFQSLGCNVRAGLIFLISPDFGIGWTMSWIVQLLNTRIEFLWMPQYLHCLSSSIIDSRLWLIIWLCGKKPLQNQGIFVLISCVDLFPNMEYFFFA